MTSSGSSKDLAKALNGFFARAPTLPLPAEINGIIASYLERHDKPDEGAGGRLGDELRIVWDKLVRDNPEKYVAFLTILRRLRPGLRTPERVFKWWDMLLDPVLEHVGQVKGLARVAMDHTLDLLSVDEYDDPDALGEEGLMPLVSRLLTLWMEAFRSQPKRGPSTDLKLQMIDDALMAFGKKEPKGFMTALDRFVVKREHRNSALSLLCAFISSGPPHLHLILQTPLFGNILHSLQKDESTVTINMALVALVMILPFIPSSLVPFLPTLFNIYARLLFWDRDSYFAQQHTEMGAENGDNGGGIAWDTSLLDPDHDGYSIPYLPEYFTFLYGMYPINFLDYVRKPQRYLRHANNADDIDIQAMEIRDRSDRFRKRHLLHPNFYNFTIESEKTDLSRWIKKEADEVIADCTALVIEQTPAPGHVRPTTPLPSGSVSVMGEEPESLDAALLATQAHANPSHPALSSSSISIGRANTPSIRRGSQSSQQSAYNPSETRSREPAGDSPTLPPDVGQPIQHSQREEMSQPSSLFRSGLQQSLANDSVPSLVLNAQDQGVEKSPLQRPVASSSRQQKGSSAEVDDQMALLQHHRLRLNNDLQYERFIKEQHMVHMGELRRRQIRVSATEAETQNLVMANRSLKQRLDEAKRGEAQIRKEFDHRRNMTKKWESDLSNKLRGLREEQKKWAAEGSELKQQLEKSRAECENLRRLVTEAEYQRLQSEQDLEVVDINAAMVEKLKSEIARLSASERALQGQQTKAAAAEQDAELVKTRAEKAEHDAALQVEELRRAESDYQAQIEDLKAQLTTQEARREASTEPTNISNVVNAYEASLSSARAKTTALQKQYDALAKKNAVLESTLLDIRSEIEQQRDRRSSHNAQQQQPEHALPSPSLGFADAAESEAPPILPRHLPSVRGNNAARQELEAAERMSPGTNTVGSVPQSLEQTTPLGSHDTVGSLGTQQGAGLSGTNTGSSGGSGSGTGTSERPPYGRGGVQNSGRKDTKDKKDDKSAKKEKKPMGMRAIRGFV
ncbi:Hamartin protein-domain-containing protein [Chaetomium sp. MPI-SDFR-AT-0129]|nr:Hamartin protein-domain-containing protein [Chaetomium sp. MPI-SDFR-AT-0129]